MRQHVTTHAIVLSRINFQEADRIITVLTLDRGKVRLIAKGVRKSRSKMAGGIELFSVNEITYIPGKGDLCTLISSRLVQYFKDIVKNLDRTMLGYEILKKTNSIIQDAAGQDYFDQLAASLVVLDSNCPLGLVELSFMAQLLSLEGNAPALTTLPGGAVLPEAAGYSFNFDAMAFSPDENGMYTKNHIKLLRSAVAWSPQVFCAIQAPEAVVIESVTLLKKIVSYN